MTLPFVLWIQDRTGAPSIALELTCHTEAEALALAGALLADAPAVEVWQGRRLVQALKAPERRVGGKLRRLD